MSPMPDNNQPWPLPALVNIAPKMAEWDAWYVGEPAALDKAYRTQTASPQQRVRASQVAGGVVGAVGRAFWGRPRFDLTSPPERKVHVPLAADIAQASADLLFSTPPTVTVTRPGAEPTAAAAQERMDYLIDAGSVWDVLADAAELQAALGGTFVRAWWDVDAAGDRAFLTRVDADVALPTFQYDTLVEVIFFYELEVRGQEVYRHAERHYLAPDGTGMIEHALYVGTAESLGTVHPYEDHPAMADLAGIVDANRSVSTLTPGLAVEYIPNLRPQRRWRRDTVGRSLGRSDYDGIEPLMDALDSVFTEWINEVIRSKNRIIAADSVLDAQAPGGGAVFDYDRSVFTPLHALTPRDGGSLPLEVVQFTVDVARYQATCQEMTTTILRACGYSAATFGEDEAGAAKTATEVDSRDARTETTREKSLTSSTPLSKAGIRRETFWPSSFLQ